MQYLEFEKPIQELDLKIAEAEAEGRAEEVERLKARLEKVINNIYSRLTPWQRVLLARHPERPHALDFIEEMFDEWVELHGDRVSGEDPAVVAGFGKLGDETVFFSALEKGRTTREKQIRNFGMAQPYGYRKAIRVMKLAERFKKPFLTLVDTPGAYPGIEAEEKGQAFAIAESIDFMLSLKVPTVAVIIGEGGSGGALALASSDRILMLENAIFSVISPEGCASILFRDASKAPEAAASLKLTAKDLLELGIVDEVIPEPPGGAHRHKFEVIKRTKETVLKNLKELRKLHSDDLILKRREKFYQMGVFRVEL